MIKLFKECTNLDGEEVQLELFAETTAGSRDFANKRY
jgi:hypothetical protein